MEEDFPAFQPEGGSRKNYEMSELISLKMVDSDSNTSNNNNNDENDGNGYNILRNGNRNRNFRYGPYNPPLSIRDEIDKLSKMATRIHQYAGGILRRIGRSSQPGLLTMDYRRQIRDVFSTLKDCVLAEMQN